MVYPDNVLHLATECNNKNHSAAFPDALPEWFIKLFTVEDDVVLDPFMGSGTAVIVAHRMGRKAIGIEILAQYLKLVEEKTLLLQTTIFDDGREYEKPQND